MADEKILKEEVLDDAELENVAGGSDGETFLDADRLYRMGLLNLPNRKRFGFGIDAAAKSKVPGIVEGLGKELGLDIQYKSYDNGNNEYIIEGQSFSRKEFWEIIDEGLSASGKRVFF